MSYQVVVARYDVPFGSNEVGQLLADIYTPSLGQPRGAILLTHGGAWQYGSKSFYREWGPCLASAGYVAVAIDYRLSRPTYSTWPGVFDDVRRAFEWLVGQAEGLGFDPMRIGLIGDSAGAQLSMLLALDEHAARHIRAVVPVYGVFDLVAFWEYSHTGRPDDPAGRLMGGNPSEKPDAYFVASPLQRLRRLAKTGGKFGVPCLAVWGDADEIAPPSQSVELVACLRDIQSPVKPLCLPGAGHFWFVLSPGRPGGGVRDEPNASLAPVLLDFLKVHLSA